MAGIDIATRIVVAAAVLASAGIVWLFTDNPVMAAGVFAGVAAGVGGVVLVRSLYPPRVAGDRSEIDWSVARVMSNNDVTGIVVTERSGRIVSANDLYASWFGGFAKPDTIVFAGRGAERLADAVAKAWREGKAGPVELSLGELDLVVDLERAGSADSYLVHRFATVGHADIAQEIAGAIEGRAAAILGEAGVMVALVGREGRIRAATPSFAYRAMGRHEGAVTGRDFTAFLRVDDRGMVFFEREAERATPLRLIQMPVDLDDAGRGPVIVALIDEDGGAIERGVALSYIETLLSLLPFGLAMVDRDGRFLFLNDAFARMAGIPDGRSPAYPGDIVVKEDKAAIGEVVRRYAVGQQTGGDLMVRLKAQPDENTVMSIAGVRGLGEAAVLLSLKDSNEEAKLKRQVAQATKMQAVGQLAGGVAHDFNNILTAILGYCDLMLMRHSPGDSDYDDIQQVRGNANRAANLTRQLLAFSRQQTLRPQILQLSDVVSDVGSLLTRLMDEKIRIAVRHGRGMGSVRADPGQLEQVIVNLAVNARDAMLAKDAKGGGELTIETYGMKAGEVARLGSEILPTADYSVLRMGDSGTGIAPEHLGKIFEPFFTTKPVGKGTGLGLSTVYGIVKQSGGYIFADSQTEPGEGQGTRFTIYFPVHEKREADAEKVAAPEKPKHEWGTGEILLVEDEDMVRAVAERALTRAGYTVTGASDGEEALELAAKMETIDLLLSDVVMPRMDGPTMAAKLREARPDLPVLFMSGYAEEQLRKSITLENVGFLPKPFSVAQLTETVGKSIKTNDG
ncbi:response regulator [Sphingorhabdus soli]|uniref:histidine kinase n=1 Tax=Flavisphingopyxis soli TaxID=2601267 RepID=A0A5C6UB64_9SPHN|nr:response regulator [Sphingorhabdus soli]TXC68958.1 response regulator [Sphingorhabdus soli]